MLVRFALAATLLVSHLTASTWAVRSRAPPHRSTWDEFSSAGLHVAHEKLWKNLQMPAIIDLLFTEVIANYKKISPNSYQLIFPSGESLRLNLVHSDPIYHYVTLRASHISQNAIMQSFKPTSLVLHAQARPYAAHDSSASLMHTAFSLRANAPKKTLRQARFMLSALLQSGHDGARAQIHPFPCNAHFRTYSGSCNNVARPKWGAFRAALRRLKSPRNPAFKPGTNDPLVADLPNPRKISRLLFRQTVSIPSRRRVSVLAVFWGQFIDHDVGITPESGGTISKQNMDIRITDTTDPYFKRHAGRLHFTRSRGVRDGKPCCGNGISERFPRAAVNEQSSYIDASHVYGCARKRVNALRTWKNGKLRTGVKWINGEFLLPRNDASDVGVKLDVKEKNSDFVSGDTRVNEQPVLASLHTIFMREHNRIAKKLRKKFACWQDEKIFQYSRRIVSAQIQLITYRDFLPTILGKRHGLKPYRGYKKHVDASIATFFSTVAFRFGHSMVPNKLNILVRRDEEHARSGMPLHDAFFAPEVVKEIGVEAFLLGASHQIAENVDTKVVASLQNELFRRKTKGIDLVTLNIQRGRDHGIPPYNDAKAMYGLSRKASFEDVTNNKDVVNTLKRLYRSVDKMEAYVGGLAEPHMEDSELGELFHAALVEQFTRLRNGDRFFYRRLKWPKEMNGMAEILEIRKNSLKLANVFIRNSGGLLNQNDFPKNLFKLS